VRREERVAIQLPDCLEFVATFLGAMKIGAVPVPLNTLASTADLMFFLTDSRAKVLVTTPQLGITALIAGAPNHPEALLAILLVGGSVSSGSALDMRVRRFEDAVGEASPELDPAVTSADEPCYWLYSSGTTGRPKGVVHLHGDMLNCVVPYAEDILQI